MKHTQEIELSAALRLTLKLELARSFQAMGKKTLSEQKASAYEAAHGLCRRLMYPTDVLHVVAKLTRGGFDPLSVRNAGTTEEFQAMLADEIAGCLEMCEAKRQQERTEKDAKEIATNEEELGEVLAKAISDTFMYAVGLTNGDVIYFEEAKRVGRNHLELMKAQFMYGYKGANDKDRDPDSVTYGLGFPRGIEVRIDQIAWAVDAPFGS